jgi:phospholipid/cholesterol/gamma-HCH transport system substrate-binding protein
MVVFVASCVGLLLFLWISFGGATPFAARGYRVSAEFKDAVELGQQSDVRISGVSVGKVVQISLDKKTGLTKAVMQFDPKYAPRPADTRAILRSKSLLGETYIELSPGTQSGPKLPDGGMIPHAQVAPSVQLDQILSTFDPKTREAFMIWQQQYGAAVTGRGEDFNRAFAELYPFATNVNAVLAVLNRDSAATSTLLRDGGQVFSALSHSPAALQGFVNNSNAVFAATAAQDRALSATIHAFPAFTVALRQTIDRVNAFADNTKPLIDELRPAAVKLTPALQKSVILAPELRDLMVDIGPLVTASAAGVPAFEHFLDETVPWLTRLKPYLGNIVPVVNYINDYRREIAAFFANSTATSQATLPNILQTKQLHYLRISNPVNPEVLTTYQKRLSSNRPNPYMTPSGYSQLASGLSVFGGYLCTNTPQPSIGPTIEASLAEIVRNVYYTARPQGPRCKAQGPLGAATTGQQQSFPQLRPLP